MGLIHLLVFAVLALAGFLLGEGIGLVVPLLRSPYTTLSCILLLVVSLADILFDRLEVLPPPPRCLSCGRRDYHLVDDIPAHRTFECTGCGQTLALHGSSATFLHENGSVKKSIAICFPKFVGRWR
jgi:hypothetical protein